MSKRSRRKARSTFFKDPVESIAGHIGQIIDSSSILDIAEAMILGGMSYYGYKMVGEMGLIIGPLGYKLATTMGGTPPVSQTAGLAILGAMGLYGGEERLKAIAEAQKIALEPEEDKPFYTDWVMAQITGSTMKGYCEWMLEFHPDVKAKVCYG